MLAVIGSRLIILVFGTLYPAYASYKAVRNKDVKAYVQWMMYWIVFALFTCAETFSDVFLSFWVPFYYEIKVIIVIWLLSPATKGSSLLYRKFVHPTLTEREKEIDEYLAKMREKSYSTMLELGSKGINYALQTAIKGGGGLVSQLRKSYSLSDLSDKTDGPAAMHEQDLARPRAQRVIHPMVHPEDSDDMDEVGGVSHRGYSPRRSASGSGRMEMYFPAVDVEVRQRGAAGAPAQGKNATPLSDDAGFSGDSMEVDEPLVRTASLSSTRTSSRLRRPANPAAATTPSGRKSVSSVSEANEAVVESPSLPSSPLPSTFSEPEQSETETSTSSEQSTVIESLAKDTDVFEEAVEGSTPIESTPSKEIELKVATVSEAELSGFDLEETQILNDIESITPECIEAEIVPFLDECEESNLCDIIDQNIEQEQFKDADKVTETNSTVEVTPTPVEETEKDTKPDVEIKTEEAPKELNINKASQNVLVTVEMSMPQSSDKQQSGSMVVRLSMESLPTSSKSAENMQRELESDSMIPLVVEKYQDDKDTEALQSSTDSLASCSLPGTPNVSRSNSSMSEARAGKYNKLPAPPRPESPAEESAVKARLVLKPGLVRNLPQSPQGESSQLFLAAPPRSKDKKAATSDGKKKHRSSSGLSSIFPSWLAKPQDKKDETVDEKKTVPMKAKMTNL